jgi:tetratricopeptide (TPR) repeat protein
MPTRSSRIYRRGGRAQVLVTSNAHAWRGVASAVEIRLWPKEIGADYLIERTGRLTERNAALALSEALGGLPLAHEQAAAYCERLDLALAEYARRFEAAPAKFLDDARHAPAEYHDGLTVAKTFALAIDEAAKLHPAAEPLIIHAALLAPEPIPLYLFAEARDKLGDPLASTLADDGLDEAVAALRAFGLLDPETIADERDPSITTDCIRLHRLVRQVASARREGEARDAVRRALIEAVAAVYPDYVWRDSRTWPRVRRLDALALGLVSSDAVLPAAEERARNLVSFPGPYRYGLYERALAICEKALGPEHPATGESLNDLALLLKNPDDLATARPLFERNVAICEKALGPEHPKTAQSVNNLALLLQVAGDLATARPLYERALAMWENVLGHAHPNTNRARSNLAKLLATSGSAGEALPHSEAALAAHDKALGPNHPWTKDSARVTADALDALGRADEAAALRERYGLRDSTRRPPGK